MKQSLAENPSGLTGRKPMKWTVVCSIISLLVSNIYGERPDSSYALEYHIDLSSYFRLPDNTVEESSQAPIIIDDDVCEFTLQGSGLEGNGRFDWSCFEDI
jgi:hypothetical protein